MTPHTQYAVYTARTTTDRQTPWTSVTIVSISCIRCSLIIDNNIQNSVYAAVITLWHIICWMLLFGQVPMHACTTDVFLGGWQQCTGEEILPTSSADEWLQSTCHMCYVQLQWLWLVAKSLAFGILYCFFYKIFLNVNSHKFIYFYLFILTHLLNKFFFTVMFAISFLSY